MCIPAAERIGPGDKYLAAELASVGKTPVVAIVTKTDEASREQIARQLVAVGELGDWADVVPVSAVSGFQLDVLTDVLISHLPPGRPLYPDGDLTDEPEQQLVAELIREAILEGVRDELPHSIAVVVEEMGPRAGREDMVDVHAIMYVERPSQKAIVIGAKGARLKAVGTQARQQIEALLGRQGLPGPADQDRQGLAARPQAAAPPGLLRLSCQDLARNPGQDLARNPGQDLARNPGQDPARTPTRRSCPGGRPRYAGTLTSQDRSRPAAR